MNLLRIFLFVISTKTFPKPSVKGALRYQKINFFTMPASFNHIIWVNEFSSKGALFLMEPGKI